MKYAVIDKNGTYIFRGMYRLENAESEAEHLNRTGMMSFMPYSVVVDDGDYAQAQVATGLL